jgi:hypothetical protein
MARILTCLDSSLYARSCADLALWAARRSGGSVKLLNVIRPARPKPDHASAAAIDTRPELFAGQAAGDVEHHRLIEAQAQALCMLTEDFKRAHDAFVAKQKPVFQGN